MALRAGAGAGAGLVVVVVGVAAGVMVKVDSEAVVLVGGAAAAAEAVGRVEAVAAAMLGLVAGVGALMGVEAAGAKRGVRSECINNKNKKNKFRKKTTTWSTNQKRCPMKSHLKARGQRRRLKFIKQRNHLIPWFGCSRGAESESSDGSATIILISVPRPRRSTNHSTFSKILYE